MTPLTPLDVANTKAQMRKGILEFCILLIISEDKTYTNDILQELRQADLIVVEGTIYPILNRLKNAGLLTYDWSESKNGPPRKYYSITSQGKAFLRQLLSTWESLDHSINALLKKFH
ncbi:PadR family transcriptional regulator [Patescibacteria group bacterium]|nr:PadR family transcriptional regulator [Patescibacteria group bacterium]MBP9710517.1 PadR family transcriptional regulator [Patescibacteria group bacterium]